MRSITSLTLPIHLFTETTYLGWFSVKRTLAPSTLPVTSAATMHAYDQLASNRT